MKKVLFLFFALLLVFSVSAMLMHNDESEDATAEMVIKAFDVTGADAVVSEIYVRGRAALQPDITDPAGLLEDIITETGAEYHSDIPAFNIIDTDLAAGQEINYIIDENKNLKITILEESKEKNDEDLIFISFTDTSRCPDLKKNYDAVTNVLNKYKINYRINVALTGCIGKKLSDKELENMFERVFSITKAEKVEGMNDNGLVSVSAFSPAIGRNTLVDGKRVNLNIAARYNFYEGKTYIWLATPVIITEY